MRTSVQSKTSAVDYVVERITSEITEGGLKPGDRLPTEPELAAKYGVGRNSVREGIKQLQAFGVLYIKRADGTFVKDSYAPPMLNPLLYSLILKKRDWSDFVQLREVIDIGTLHVALKNPDVVQIVPRLLKLVEQTGQEMAREKPSVDRILDLDLAFHRVIACAIHNPQIDTITDQIAKLTIPSRRITIQQWLDSGQKDRFLELHRQIAEVIQKRDIGRIEQVVADHYVLWK